jgi:hypothetical protein
MTILAGIISFDRSVGVPDAACSALRAVASRDRRDVPIELRADGAYFVKIDIDAFACPAHGVSTAGSLAMLAGEPLLTCQGPSGTSRDAHLAFMHTEWDRGEVGSARTASGTFCAAYYDPRTRTARLLADRLGLRPLYYSVVGPHVYFASALRILEALADVPKSMNVSAVAELTGFGYPFGDGTPYAGIRVLQPCETLTFRDGEIKSTRYFDWDSIQPSEASEEDALIGVYERFQAAVRRRLQHDTTTFAYLSGGLDSRCVVAALRALGTHLNTYNFSLPNTQDQVFGREFALRIGAVHHELPTEPGPDWSAVMAKAWNATRPSLEPDAERPKLAWTGEGGSVGLGHVYLTPELVGLLRTGDMDAAVRVFLKQQQKHILTRILDPRLAAQLTGHLHARLCSELRAIRYPDPVRAFYIFLNLNGPRRHLVRHYDTIDAHRLEFQMPFYDSEFLEYVTSIAVDPCLYHQFYVKWLSFFDPAVLAVPWQAYPGHVRSPLTIPGDLLDQWAAPASPERETELRQDLLRRGSAMLNASAFPKGILRKSYLRLTWWAWNLNVADYGYALKTALTYYGYWQATEGKVDLPLRVN